LSNTSGQHISHDNFIDFRAGEFQFLHGISDQSSSQTWGRRRGKRATKFTDGCATGVSYDSLSLFHQRELLVKSGTILNCRNSSVKAD
jgi:hypothetical protein